VIGPNADRKLLGGYSGEPKYYTTVLQGIKEKVGNDAHVVYSEGCKITLGGSWNEDAITFPDPEDDRKSIAQAVAVAQKADTVILVLGGNEQTSREAWNKTHMGDRANLDLIGMQNDLVKAIVETGKPIVVVLFNGRPNSIPIFRNTYRRFSNAGTWVRNQVPQSPMFCLAITIRVENYLSPSRVLPGIYLAITIISRQRVGDIWQMMFRRCIHLALV
jgi:hypothetical protein